MSKNNIGLPPGTLLKSDKQINDFSVKIINYDEKSYEILDTKNIEESIKFINKLNNTWIHVKNLNDLSILEKLGNTFNIHSLILEDISTYTQRPKIECYDEYIFTVVKLFKFNKDKDFFDETQISMILGKNYVISIQNSNEDFFYYIDDRIKNNKGYIRKKKADYLMYAILDIIIDNFFILLEDITDKFEELEDEIIEKPTKKSLNSLYFFKNKIINIQKSIWPFRELINKLRNTSSKFIDKSNMVFLNDVYDHMIQIIDNIQSIREMVSNMFDMYLSSISNKMNEIMKVLSIIGTIFIPLTFIAGIYGMNFKFMPELDFKYGYPVVLGVIGLTAIGMLIYFKIKKWF